MRNSSDSTPASRPNRFRQSIVAKAAAELTEPALPPLVLPKLKLEKKLESRDRYMTKYLDDEELFVRQKTHIDQHLKLIKKAPSASKHPQVSLVHTLGNNPVGRFRQMCQELIVQKQR